MLKDNAKFGEIRVKLYEMFQEVTFRVQYTGILWGMWFRVAERGTLNKSDLQSLDRKGLHHVSLEPFLLLPWP